MCCCIFTIAYEPPTRQVLTTTTTTKRRQSQKLYYIIYIYTKAKRKSSLSLFLFLYIICGWLGNLKFLHVVFVFVAHCGKKQLVLDRESVGFLRLLFSLSVCEEVVGVSEEEQRRTWLKRVAVNHRIASTIVTGLTKTIFKILSPKKSYSLR